MTTAEKIAQMQAAKNTRRIDGPTKLSSGKWRHPFDANEFDREDDCRADFRFCKDWGRK
jgi:hypothetical protein